MKNLVFTVILAGLSVSCLGLWNKNSGLQKEISSLKAQQRTVQEAATPSAESFTKANQTQAPTQTIAAKPQENCAVQTEAPVCDCDSQPSQDFASNIESTRIDETVTRKYELLLGALNLGRDEEEQVSALLAAREKVLNVTSHGYFTEELDSELTIEERDQKLAGIDDEINSILGSDVADTYELLKDSQFEQYQIREFDNSLDSQDFLSEHQSQSLLMAKLEEKRAFDAAIKDARELIKSGKQADGFKAFDQAIESYKNNYLNRVSGDLNDQQFSQLKTFEQEKFGEMLSSLKAPYEDRAFD